MATVSFGPTHDADIREGKNARSGWEDYFTPMECQHLIDEDLLAGRRVPLVLASIVGVGVILALLSVLLTG
jgi:hypothetical protein